MSNQQLPTIRVDMSLEERKSALIQAHYLETADADYLTARWAWDNGLFYNFCWSAAQAVEKYLKAALLYNDRSATDFGHKLTDLYAEIGKLTTQVAWLKKKLQV